MTLRLYALTGNKVLRLQTCIAKTAQSMSQSFHSKACTQTACSVHCTIYSLWMGIMENLLGSPVLSFKKRSCFGHVINPLLIVQACLVKTAGCILASFFLSGPSLHLSSVYEAYCAFSVNVVSAPSKLNTTFRNCTLSVQRSGYLFILL